MVFVMDLKNKKVLVVGTGVSGIGAVKLLEKVGAKAVLYDQNEKLLTEEIRRKLPLSSKAKIITGRLPEEILSETELVVLSPGVPADTGLAEAFKARGVRVWGEIELAYNFSQGKIAAITGTNGKTTTTSLVGRIMQEYYKDVHIVGNIGNPYTEIALDTGEDTVIAAEISSFQLETIDKFKPRVSAILNITPDHLNRHHSMENYIAVKEKIAGNQTPEEVCVLNYEDEHTREFGKRCPARVIFFSSGRKLEKGIWLEGEDIFMSDGEHTERLLGIHDMNLIGRCNVENVMAAIAIALCMEVPVLNILNTVRSFKAVEHRIEFVATKNGVDYYNDSKGTNPDAAIQGIRAMSRPTVLIGGGYDKQSEYDEWIEAFEGKVKCFVLIGQTADKIEECAKKHGIKNIVKAGSFEEALEICTNEAVPGDAVLLSPACASWGMFPNYEERGRVFKEYVNSLD